MRARVRTQVLFVEPDVAGASSLRREFGHEVALDTCSEFSNARRKLLANTYQFVVTNLRVREYNGLHLIYLIQAAGMATRAIVYTDSRDRALAQDVQRAGAFYELRERLPYVLRGYFNAALPAADRRDAAITDRRGLFRGGRRSSDLEMLSTMKQGSV